MGSRELGFARQRPMLPFFIQWSRPSCEDGFGHPIMLAGQGPRTIGHRDDLVQPPQFTDKGDGAQISEAMGKCSRVPQASPDGAPA